ncbi:MAG: hypothetical protein DMG41_25000 [Acidobacteria bacterium]|nr:MAG: hypothetical protein AUH13_15390 [Acidobacteria bacterium 13_2_20CM_58_27]PYT85134.1 MAG: hypothetical protein DMG41_25000 [Acidobacteriota bacterium]
MPRLPAVGGLPGRTQLQVFQKSSLAQDFPFFFRMRKTKAKIRFGPPQAAEERRRRFAMTLWEGGWGHHAGGLVFHQGGGARGLLSRDYSACGSSQAFGKPAPLRNKQPEWTYSKDDGSYLKSLAIL